MTKDEIKSWQRQLKQLGYYAGEVDGILGPLSKAAISQVVYDAEPIATKGPNHPPKGDLAWGAKVSPGFRHDVRYYAQQLDMPKDGADWIMACIAFETGETFSPAIRNMAGSGATGLIQFMPKTAIELGTTVEELSFMSPVEQLQYVAKYFMPYKGRLRSLADVYMAILWPAAIGKPDGYVLWDMETRSTTYRQNAGLDLNKDGQVTKHEACRRVLDKLAKGRRPELLG